MTTLLKMIKFKFEQQCPIHQVRVQNFSFDQHNSTSGSSYSSPIGSRRLVLQSASPSMDEQEMGERAENQNVHKKTIQTLEEDLEGLRSRVSDLEQEKHETQLLLAAKEREDRASCVINEEIIVGLERQKEENQKLKQLLKEEREKVCHYSRVQLSYYTVAGPVGPDHYNWGVELPFIVGHVSYLLIYKTVNVAPPPPQTGPLNFSSLHLRYNMIIIGGAEGLV